MLVKEWELENYKNQINNFNAILIYGTDRGKVNFISESLIAYLKNFYKNKLEVIKPSYEKLNNNEISFLELVAQKSIFHEKTIVNINLDLTKINKEEIASLERNISAGANLVIFESAALKNNSYVLKEFKKSNKFICVACYQDNARNITQSINYYAKRYGINLDNNITNYLADKLGNDKMITKQEMIKLSLYADNKTITFEAVLEGLGDNSILGIYKISDNFLLRNNVNLNYIYDKLINSGLNYLIIIRSLIKHLQTLLYAKSLANKNVTSIRPPLHFSRHDNIQMQLNSLSIKKIENKLVELNFLEKKCKIFPSLSNVLVKEFLILH